MKKVLWAVSLVSVCALSLSAAPGSITVGAVSQDAGSRLVTVPYSLDGAETAIVTASITVGERTIELTDKAFGDVNAEVAPGARSFRWQPPADLADIDCTGGVSLRLKAWSLSTPPDYMVVSLSCPGYVRYYVSPEAVPGGLQDSRYFADLLLLRKIPARNVRYRKGALSTEESFAKFGVATSYVTLTKDFYLGVYEVTQRQWQRLTGTNPPQPRYLSHSAYAGKPHDAAHRTDWERHPLTDVSWNEAVEAANGLAETSGRAFALPSEAEWEFACRAECGSELYTGKAHNNDNCSEIACIFPTMSAYYGGKTKDFIVGGYADAMPCGLLMPNKWNLYDMLGNVREYCSDEIDGQIVVKGGECAWSKETCRSGARELLSTGSADYRTGFRFYLPIP